MSIVSPHFLGIGVAAVGAALLFLKRLAKREPLASLADPASGWRRRGPDRFEGELQGRRVEFLIIPERSGRYPKPPALFFRVDLPTAPEVQVVLRPGPGAWNIDLRDRFTNLPRLLSPPLEGLAAFGRPPERATELLEGWAPDYHEWRRKLKRWALTPTGIRFRGSRVELRFEGRLWDEKGGPSAKDKAQACLEGARPFLNA